MSADCDVCTRQHSQMLLLLVLRLLILLSAGLLVLRLLLVKREYTAPKNCNVALTARPPSHSIHSILHRLYGRAGGHQAAATPAMSEACAFFTSSSST